ncbi:hypothetical protein BDV11DRAFT_167354 [Aspergillus similis]
MASISIHSKIQVLLLYSSNRPTMTSFAPLVANDVETMLVVAVALEVVVVPPLEPVLELSLLSVLLPLSPSLESVLFHQPGIPQHAQPLALRVWENNKITDFHDSCWDLIGSTRPNTSFICQLSCRFALTSRGEARLDGVATFLSSGGFTGESNDKPYLFCGDSFAQEQSWRATTRDGTGAGMVKERNGNGEPTSYYIIEEVYPNLRKMQLDRVAATSRADNNTCTEAGSPVGFTYATFSRHVYFCYVAFQAKPGKPHGYETLAEVVNSNNYYTAGAETDPSVLTSLSCTLYHELLHLADTQ